MHRSPGRCLRTSRCGFWRPWPLLRLHAGPWSACAGQRVKQLLLLAREAATYTHTETAVAFGISELPGERAEALLYCNGSVGAHGGRAITNRPWLRLRAVRYSARETRQMNRRAP